MRLNLWHDMCEDTLEAIERGDGDRRAMTTVVDAQEKHRLLRELGDTALAYQSHIIDRLGWLVEDEVRRVALKYGLDLDNYKDWPKE